MNFKRGKKLTQAILSIRDAGTVIGTIGEREILTRDDGSQVTGNFGQVLETIEMTNPSSGEITKYWVDGGLRGSLKMAKVKPGDMVEIVHTGEKRIEQGTVQTYDIYEVQN